MMKVLHVIDSISRQGGGPSRSSQGLVAAIRSKDIEAWLMTINKGEDPWINGVDKFVNGGDFEAAIDQVKPDIVHIHGLWNSRLHHCVVVCRAKNIPYVIAPRGMLEPWSLKTKWLKKRIARFLYQDRDLKMAAALHATAESEAEQFRSLGFTNYVIISPNGVNVPEQKVEVKVKGVGERRRALFCSRMHHKKGVMELVESWARVFSCAEMEKCRKNWVCELVYTMQGEVEKRYEEQVKQRVLELGLSYQDQAGTIHSPIPIQDSDFIFTGALEDDKKWEAYARADLFVLPTYSENFGIVVAEALWAGVPVITTKGTPWRDMEGYKCGWWIDLPPKDSLDRALQEAFSTSNSDLKFMGRNGHELVREKYSWPAVVQAMIYGYEQILNTCELAPCDTCSNYGDTCPIR